MPHVRYPSLGSVSSGTLRGADLAEAFFSEADSLGGHVQWGNDFLGRNSWWNRLGGVGETLWTDDSGEITADDETIADCVETLTELLSEIAPPYTYFGAHEGDGADFGFWPDWQAIEELARFDDFPDTLPEEDFIVVNDHGNVSVYGSDGKLIWDCV